MNPGVFTLGADDELDDVDGPGPLPPDPEDDEAVGAGLNAPPIGLF